MAKKPIFGLGKYGILQISKPDFGIEQDYGITNSVSVFHSLIMNDSEAARGCLRV